MTDASRVMVNTDVMLPTPVGAASGMPSSAQSDAGAARRRRAAASEESNGVEEIVDDTAQVSLVGSLISQASMGSDVRFQKVASLRQAIKAGVYHVSAADLAEKMIEDMLRPRLARSSETETKSEIE